MMTLEPCGKCGAKLVPVIVTNLAGKEEQWTLQYGGKMEPVFRCPNGCVMFQTETETNQRNRRERFKPKGRR